MKNFILIIFAICLPAIAEQKKSDPEDVLKDVRLVCEMSKFGQTLLATPEFKNNKPMVAFRVAEMLSATLKTWEAKAAYSGLRMGDLNSKREGWKKLAKDYGAKDWDCPSLSEFGG